MLCSKCGATIDDGASFCAACGEPVLTDNDAADKSLFMSANFTCVQRLMFGA